MNEGWQCPKCKKIYAPSVKSCERCSPFHYQCEHSWVRHSGGITCKKCNAYEHILPSPYKEHCNHGNWAYHAGGKECGYCGYIDSSGGF